MSKVRPDFSKATSKAEKLEILKKHYEAEDLHARKRKSERHYYVKKLLKHVQIEELTSVSRKLVEKFSVTGELTEDEVRLLKKILVKGKDHIIPETWIKDMEEIQLHFSVFNHIKGLLDEEDRQTYVQIMNNCNDQRKISVTNLWIIRQINRKYHSKTTT